MILRKIFYFQILDLTKISFKSCSAMKSAGIFVSGDYLINGFSTPQTCQLWGRSFLRPCHLPDLRTLSKKKLKINWFAPHQKICQLWGRLFLKPCRLPDLRTLVNNYKISFQRLLVHLGGNFLTMFAWKSTKLSWRLMMQIWRAALSVFFTPTSILDFSFEYIS